MDTLLSFAMSALQLQASTYECCFIWYFSSSRESLYKLVRYDVPALELYYIGVRWSAWAKHRQSYWGLVYYSPFSPKQLYLSFIICEPHTLQQPNMDELSRFGMPAIQSWATSFVLYIEHDAQYEQNRGNLLRLGIPPLQSQLSTFDIIFVYIN